MPKVTQTHIEARRRQILEAAAVCFARDGFRKTTIRDICAEAGLSIGAIYGHFGSKTEIVTALAELGRGATQQLLERPSEAPAIDSLAAMVASVVAFLASPDGVMNTRLSVRLWGEALDSAELGALLRSSLDDLARPFMLEVERGQRLGEIDPSLSAAAAGRLLSAIGLGLTLHAAVDPSPDPEDIARTTTALLTGAFGTERNHP